MLDFEQLFKTKLLAVDSVAVGHIRPELSIERITLGDLRPGRTICAPPFLRDCSCAATAAV